MKIPICRPFIGKEEKEAVLAVLDSGQLAQGKEVAQLEANFARFLGIREAVATSSGTTALFTVLQALGVKTGDRVVTTPFTFVASASSIVQAGGIPVFCEVDEKTFNLDANRLEEILKANPRIKGMVVVHLYGLPCSMEDILYLAKRYQIFVVEDCAQAHGAELQGKKVGTFGDAGVFSFYPTKNMTTGEGGMIVTSCPQLADKCRMLINHGSHEKYLHQILGYNFRMNNLGAAIGLVQLRRLNQTNQKRRKNAAFYTNQLSGIPWIVTPFEPASATHVYHQYTLRVLQGRDSLRAYLKDKGIGTEVYYPLPLHQQPFLKSILGEQSFPVSENLSREVLSLPVYPLLQQEELEEIVFHIKQFFNLPSIQLPAKEEATWE